MLIKWHSHIVNTLQQPAKRVILIWHTCPKTVSCTVPFYPFIVQVYQIINYHCNNPSPQKAIYKTFVVIKSSICLWRYPLISTKELHNSIKFSVMMGILWRFSISAILAPLLSDFDFTQSHCRLKTSWVDFKLKKIITMVIKRQLPCRSHA